jgi:hypothetical protein
VSLVSFVSNAEDVRAQIGQVCVSRVVFVLDVFIRLSNLISHSMLYMLMGCDQVS